jgi:Protein of unknown function (DUF2478)
MTMPEISFGPKRSIRPHRDRRCPLSADIPVVIAVPSHRFADWIRFADGMSVKLRCDREALDAWWQAVSSRNAGAIGRDQQTVCEMFK